MIRAARDRRRFASGDLVSMSEGQLCHRALLDANRRIAELQRQLANVQQRAREAELGLFDNLRTANASIARLREALTEAREHIADATPEEMLTKIDAALEPAPVTSGQVGGWPAAPAPVLAKLSARPMKA
jgi:hypothetical protein